MGWKVKRNPLDILMSTYIRAKAEGVCEWCGQRPCRDAHHFKGRIRMTVRFDEENMVALCGYCHRYLHNNPDVNTDFFRKRLGNERYENLVMRANMTTKEYPIDKEKIKDDLNRKIKLLNEV